MSSVAVPCKAAPQLGTMTSDVEALEYCYENDKESAINKAVKMRETVEAEGVTDRHEKLQPPRSCVEETMIGLEIGGWKKVAQWCQGLVVAVKTRNRVHIQWNADCLLEEDIPISEKVLMKSKYNKHVEGGWRMSLG